MDITAQAEVVLRDAGYDTWQWPGTKSSVTCFENSAIIGFLHVFASAAELLARWEASQKAVLSRYSPALRDAGAKAWNVYSVFLAPDATSDSQREVERIEENFVLTRKIARTGIRLHEDIERALLPLVAVKAQPVLSDTDFHARLVGRLSDVPRGALAAFLDNRSAEEIARLLAEAS
jgi:hypothetical protein